jgi:hypothetical protein
MVGPYEQGNELLDFMKGGGISWLDECLFASQDELYIYLAPKFFGRLS